MVSSDLKALNISFKKVVFPGRVKSGGTEEDIVVAHGCRKREKLICGPEENCGGSIKSSDFSVNM